MLIRFDKLFALPLDEVFSYFRSPADWTRLYGLIGEVRVLADGWVQVPLQSFPFPLIARTTLCEPERRVCWEFRGFWRGNGEVRFSERDGVVAVEGYERISVRWLFFLSPIVEKALLERRFRGIWNLGWRRLEKAAERRRRDAPSA